MSRDRSSRPSSSFVRFSSVNRQTSRPQTSLGFTGRERDDPLFHTGFDVLSYFRKHGSTAELTVGVNGRPSSNVVLQNYVQDCRAEALLCELEHEEDSLQTWREKHYATTRLQSKSMRAPPSCWTEAREQQSVFEIQHGNTKGPKMAVSQPTAVVAQNKHPLIQTLQNVPHMISYGKECVLDWTTTTYIHLDIHIPSCRVRESGVKIKDLEAYPKRTLCVPELLPALFNGETAAPCRAACDQLLCIWFQLEHEQCLKKDTHQIYFQLHLNSQRSTRTFTDLQLCRVIPTAGVITVEGVRRQELTGAEISLTCDSYTIFSHTFSLSSTVEDIEAPPPRLFIERENEYSQVEDEDITDLRDIAQKYPDLHVLDIDTCSMEDEKGMIEEEKEGGMREEEGTVRDEEEDAFQLQKPAVFITVRNPTPDTDKKAVHCPSLVSSTPPNSTYSSIVRQRLAQYLN